MSEMLPSKAKKQQAWKLYVKVDLQAMVNQGSVG